jgi:hypothetical protein
VLQRGKAVTDFYIHRNGRLYICKVCHRRKMKVRRLTNSCVQQYERVRAKTPHEESIRKLPVITGAKIILTLIALRMPSATQSETES